MADEKLGRYRLLSLIATGGMGEVFLARQEGPAGFSKTVVIKRILRHLARDQGFIDLFLNEAQLAAQLQHPSITQVFGLEREGDTWFIAMEYVPGKSLRALIEACREKQLTIPPPIAVRLISQVLQGLEFAHELKDERGRALGILHRDVSAENVLVASSGMAKLVDFGIARAMRGAETRVGRPKGKLAYMAPELMVSGAAIDRRADVYGAGVLLHELLMLDRPPLGEIRDDGTPEPISYLPPDSLPQPLRDALSKALALDAKDRWPSAHAMSEALESWLTSAGHTVLAADIAAFLTTVHGAQPAAPVSLGDDVGNTGQQPAFPGTAPLPAARVQGTAPLPAPAPELPRSRTEPLLRAVTGPVAAPVAPTAPPSRTGLWILLAGIATAVVFLTITIVAIVGSQRPRVKPIVEVPIAESKPTDQVMPELVLEPPVAPVEVVDGGALVAEVERPPARPVVKKPPVKAPPPPPKKPKTGKVTVRVNPWAEVYLANKKLGVTPFNPVEVPAGSATFTLKNSQLGVTRKVTVKVPPGGNVVLRADLFK
ncbi:MAG: serine/threonine protein kinase [Myxococcaceae bacterium]|nr:serine/threonine protein kinase [Myxococcaceae bacterium]